MPAPWSRLHCGLGPLESDFNAMLTPIITAQTAVELADMTSRIESYGLAGACIAFLMAIEWRRSAREEKRDERDASREQQLMQGLTGMQNEMSRLIQATNHLTRALSIEVLTRPDALQRAKEEAKDLLASVVHPK